MINKLQAKLDYGKLDELEIETFAVTCYKCRTPLLIGNIEKAIIECKCSKCSRFTVIVAGLEY